MRTFANVAELVEHVGETIGTSDWTQIDQSRIDTFADATGDHQWIHVDAERAATGPFGATIAQGYLVLALVPALLREVFVVEEMAMAINYGLNRVRFPTPVPVDSRLRAEVALAHAEPVASGHQLVFSVAIQIEGGAKPACVAETVVRYLS